MAGLYLHIPFCRSRCGYCDFYSCTSTERIGRYVDALKDELTRRMGFFRSDALETIYFGGGTPSLLSMPQLDEVMETIRGLWDCTALGECTLEANPDDLKLQYLCELRAVGIDRLSIGIQSFDNRTLRLMNRRHNAGAAREAVKTARLAGFSNISIDLIYGVPGARNWRGQLEEAINLRPEHISAYHLGIESGTPFAERGMRPIGEKDSREQYSLLCSMLRDAGYVHYEISNFALPGREARHNSAYWSGGHYLGVGAAAHSYDGERRVWNVADVERYIGGERPQGEILTMRDRYNEFVMVGLRRAEGISMEEVASRFGSGRLGEMERKAQMLASRGLAGMGGERLFIPEEEWLVADAVISEFFDAED